LHCNKGSGVVNLNQMAWVKLCRVVQLSEREDCHPPLISNIIFSELYKNEP